MSSQPHTQRAHAAQGQEAIVGRGALAEIVGGVPQQRPARFVGDDEADEHVRMRGVVFCCRLHHQIGTVFKRIEEKPGRPGVVRDDPGPMRMRDLGDGRNILHLERVRAGALGIHHRRIWLHQ